MIRHSRKTIAGAGFTRHHNDVIGRSLNVDALECDMDYVVACDSWDVLKLIKSVIQVDSSDREGASSGSCKLHAV